jgi:hypothetical protein
VLRRVFFRSSLPGPFAEGSPLNKTISLFAISRALFSLLIFVSDDKVPWQGEQFAETMYLLFNVCQTFFFLIFLMRSLLTL